MEPREAITDTVVAQSSVLVCELERMYFGVVRSSRPWRGMLSTRKNRPTVATAAAAAIVGCYGACTNLVPSYNTALE